MGWFDMFMNGHQITNIQNTLQTECSKTECVTLISGILINCTVIEHGEYVTLLKSTYTKRERY